MIAGESSLSTPSDDLHQSDAHWWLSALKAFAVAGLALVTVVLLVAGLSAAADEPALANDVLILALPAFLAGTLSILSPCSLPLVIGYFSLVAQEQKRNLGLVTVAFLAGNGTTMAIIGAGFTAIGSLAIDYQAELALYAGVIVIGFGVMTLLGKGFSGWKFMSRPDASVGGAYVYGLIFALGWTTCVGPILGSILTMLLVEGSSTAGGLSLVAGGALSLIYVLGLGLPLAIFAGAISHGAGSNSLTRAMRGKGFTFDAGDHTVYLHSTTMISGALLIVLGFLLASGQMTQFSQQMAESPLADLGVRMEGWVSGFFGS